MNTYPLLISYSFISSQALNIRLIVASFLHPDICLSEPNDTVPCGRKSVAIDVLYRRSILDLLVHVDSVPCRKPVVIDILYRRSILDLLVVP
jgi:hypothetical protein